jgi:hypothetical protein
MNHDNKPELYDSDGIIGIHKKSGICWLCRNIISLTSSESTCRKCLRGKLNRTFSLRENSPSYTKDKD